MYVTEQTPPERAHAVDEKPAFSAAPRPVTQATFPVGPGVDCPVTVAVHLVCEPSVRGAVCVPAGEQTIVTLVDWAYAIRAPATASTRKELLRSNTTTRTNGLAFVCLASTLPQRCSADIGMT